MKFTGVVPPISKSFNNGHWAFEEQMGKGLGFVYLIRDVLNHKFYIGKKSYIGAINRGVESTWKKYMSSSKELNAMIKESHPSAFEFICLEQYTTKGTIAYGETWSLCFAEAPTRKDCYNVLIPKVSWVVRELLTPRHRTRLIQALNWEAM